MIRSLTFICALGVAALCYGPAVADVPAPGMLPAAPVTTPPSIGAATADLQAKIIAVNPRLTHHKGRQLRVFVRNRGTSPSARGSIWLRTRPGQQPAFVTEPQSLPAIAPGGEVSRTFSVPRHFRALPPLSRLEAVVMLQGGETVLPSFSANHAAQRPAFPVFPNPALNGPASLK